MPSQADYDKLKTQLLDLMSAAHQVFDNSFQSKHPTAQSAIAKLKSEYVKSAVLLKSTSNFNKGGALLNPQHGSLLQLNESMSVDLGEE